MNKKEAWKLLESGEKITHNFFLDNEYLYMEEGKVYTEDGYKVTQEFWALRQDPAWETGWHIYLKT